MPDESISRAAISGVSAEICVEHLFPPDLQIPEMPAGYQLSKVADRARGEKRFAAILASRPDYASFRVGTLCFVLSATFRVNDASVGTSEAVPMAFWWASVAASDEPPRPDSRVRGTITQVQLASWYPDEAVDRSLILAFDPMAQFVPIRIRSLGPGHWRVALELQDGRVEGEIHGLGDRRKLRPSAESKFMTVASAGPHSEYFTVFTYFGHHAESASSRWLGSGTSPVVRYIGLSGPDLGLGTEVQDSWQAQAGLYRVNSASQAGRPGRQR